MKRQLILILYIALLLSCNRNDSNQPNGNDSNQPNGNDSNQPNGMGGGFTCQPGDHDSDFDGIRNFSLECWDNGNRKKQTTYTKAGTLKQGEQTYYESNAYRKTYIGYYSDGTKSIEYTYYESNEKTNTYISYSYGTKYLEFTYYETGKQKTYIRYQADGVSFDTGYPKCYDTDGTTTETCSLDKHGIE